MIEYATRYSISKYTEASFFFRFLLKILTQNVELRIIFNIANYMFLIKSVELITERKYCSKSIMCKSFKRGIFLIYFYEKQLPTWDINLNGVFTSRDLISASGLAPFRVLLSHHAVVLLRPKEGFFDTLIVLGVPQVAVIATCTAHKTIRWPFKTLNLYPVALFVLGESVKLGEIAGVFNKDTGRIPAALSYESGHHFRACEVNTPLILFRRMQNE